MWTRLEHLAELLKVVGNVFGRIGVRLWLMLRWIMSALLGTYV